MSEKYIVFSRRQRLSFDAVQPAALVDHLLQLVSGGSMEFGYVAIGKNFAVARSAGTV